MQNPVSITAFTAFTAFAAFAAFAAASRLLPAALLALALPAQAACVVVGTCTPTTQAALQTGVRLTNGALLKPGREPPSTCH